MEGHLEAHAAMTASAHPVQSRPRDAATGRHAANDADDVESDEPDAASGHAAPTHRPRRAAQQNGKGNKTAGRTPDKTPDKTTGRADAGGLVSSPVAASPGQDAQEPDGQNRDEQYLQSRICPRPPFEGSADAASAITRPAASAAAPPAQQVQPVQHGQAACNWAAFCDFCANRQEAGRDMPRQHRCAA